MIDEGGVDARSMVLVLINAMSHDDVREALDANEMSPRFDEDEDNFDTDPLDEEETDDE